MTTPRTRAVVSRISLAVATATLALGACAGHRGPAAWDGSAATAALPLTIRFDNEAMVHVDVYLVGERREWPLGRVEPGARAMLRLPVAALEEDAGFVRLAAIPDAARTVAAGRDRRAALTIAQPASMLLGQRWTFAGVQLATPQLLGARMAGRR